MFLFSKKLVFLFFNYLCLLPNFLLYNRKTSNYHQKTNKKNLKNHGFFILSSEFLKKEKELIFSIISRLNIHKIIEEKKYGISKVIFGNYF